MEMSWLETSLSRLERRLREILEGDPAADGFSPKLHHQLEAALIAAMRSGARTLSFGNPTQQHKIAPDQYTLVLPTYQAEQLLSHPTEMDRLAQRLLATATQAGIEFTRQPIIKVVAAPEAGQIKVIAEFSQNGKGFTGSIPVEGNASLVNQSPAEALPNAFLIINGLTTFPLNTYVINIGRDTSNQVQLDDPRISRMHAQLRFVQGHFMIFDLDSRGGTFVNGVAVSSHILNPGDVILLAGLPLVYGQETALQDGYTQEVPVDSAPPLPPEVL
jgi:hypothetical protein